MALTDTLDNIDFGQGVTLFEEVEFLRRSGWSQSADYGSFTFYAKGAPTNADVPRHLRQVPAIRVWPPEGIVPAHRCTWVWVRSRDQLQVALRVARELAAQGTAYATEEELSTLAGFRVGPSHTVIARVTG